MNSPDLWQSTADLSTLVSEHDRLTKLIKRSDELRQNRTKMLQGLTASLKAGAQRTDNSKSLPTSTAVTVQIPNQSSASKLGQEMEPSVQGLLQVANTEQNSNSTISPSYRSTDSVFARDSTSTTESYAQQSTRNTQHVFVDAEHAAGKSPLDERTKTPDSR